MRDLRAGRSHEIPEDVGGDVPLVGRQLGHSPLQVGLHDRLCSAELPERVEPQSLRALLMFLVPDPFHHELQVRRFDAALVRFTGREPAPRLAQVDLSRRGLVENGLDQFGLDLDRVPGGLVVALDRLDNRLSGRAAVEMIEPKVVREEVRDAPFEPIELGERVVSQSEQHPHA